jgi:cyclophilin family peptidyl-prolyl cis-trans isomerase
VPKTARNFRELCCGDSMKGELTYKDCRFHSIVAGVMICAGDITNVSP